MQIHCSTCSVILNVTATQYACSLNGVYHPHWLVKLSLFIHAHFSPLSWAASLHWCCANLSHYTNNQWLDRPHGYVCVCVYTSSESRKPTWYLSLELAISMRVIALFPEGGENWFWEGGEEILFFFISKAQIHVYTKRRLIYSLSVVLKVRGPSNATPRSRTKGTEARPQIFGQPRPQQHYSQQPEDWNSPGVHQQMNGWSKCSIYIQWNIIQP